ncbi:MAG: hypothetical protein Q9225_001451 [Loekoesia sp. 1 TL-2023]
MEIRYNPLAPDAHSTSSVSATAATSVPISPTPSTVQTSILSPNRPLAERPRSRSPQPRKDFSFLLHSENFHPISQTEIPPPFLSHPSSPTEPLATLLRHGRYLPAATLAANTLVSNPSLPLFEIFSLFYTRLACLSITNQTHIAAQESLILGDLSSPFYFDVPNHSDGHDGGKEDEVQEDCIIPWHLRLLATRLQALGARDMRRSVQGYYDLAAYARTRHKRSTTADSKALWKEKLKDLGLRCGNALIEMGDLSGAKRLFESLVASTTTGNEPLVALSAAEVDADAEEKEVLQGWIAMLCLRMGDLEGAKRWIDAGVAVDSDPAEQGSQYGIFDALYKMAEGKYDDAATQWRALVEGPNHILATHNLAICLVYAGRLSEATRLLEDMVDQRHAFHALTFNLATMYELRTERARERKMEMVERVAESLRGREDDEGISRERVSGDFKL